MVRKAAAPICPLTLGVDWRHFGDAQRDVIAIPNRQTYCFIAGTRLDKMKEGLVSVLPRHKQN